MCSDEVRGSVLPPVDEVFPRGCWPYPHDAWEANVKRTYDWSEGVGMQRDWAHQGLAEDYRDAKSERRGDHRVGVLENRNTAHRREIEAEKLGAELREHRLSMMDALMVVYLEHKDDKHNVALATHYDNMEGARWARLVGLNVHAQRMADLDTTKKAMDNSVATLDRAVRSLETAYGPARGGERPSGAAAPATPGS